MTRRRVTGAIFASVIAGCALLGCGRSDSAKDEVLVTVNGEPITRLQLDIAIGKMMDKNAAPATLDNEIERKILEGMVMMRAIAERQAAEMTPEQAALLDAKTQQYREELLVESYLRTNARPFTPSEAEIGAYYNAHPELFGAETVYSYEILSPARVPADHELKVLLEILNTAGSAKDWARFAARYAKHSVPLVFAQGQTGGPALDRNLSGIIRALKVGETSNVAYIGGKPQLVRVTGAEVMKPLPLAAVRERIRDSLAAQHLKKEIKDAAEQILAASDVSYKEQR